MLDFSVTFIITIFNIAFLFFILRKLLFKPVTKFMAERAKRVQDTIDQTERDKAKAEKLLAEYEGKLKEADAHAEEILKAAREGAERDVARIIAEGKAAAEALIVNARRQLEAEQRAVLAKFRVEAAALVMAAASKLVVRELGGEDNKRYVNMLLDELSARKGNN